MHTKIKAKPMVDRGHLGLITYGVKTMKSKPVKNTERLLFKQRADQMIDQNTILLTKKETVTAPTAKNLTVFNRLNEIEMTVTDEEEKRNNFLRDHRFAGIAFANISNDNYGETGGPGMVASKIGGLTTVRAYRHQPKVSTGIPTKFQPGAVVRWTIPYSSTEAPIDWGDGAKNAIFAELEEVTAPNLLKDVLIQKYQNDRPEAPYGTVEKWAENQLLDVGIKKDLTDTITAMLQLQEREIGVVVGDNGEGSIDIRLR